VCRSDVDLRLSWSSNVLTTIERSLSTASELVSATWLNCSLTRATSKYVLVVPLDDAEASPPKLTMPRSMPPPPPPLTLVETEAEPPALVLVLE